MNPPNPTCRNCGAPLAPDARFCEKCGKPAAYQPGYPGSSTSAPVQPGSRQGSKTWLIVGIGGAALIGILFCGLVASFVILTILRPAAVSIQPSSPPAATEVSVMEDLPTDEPLAATTAPEEAPAIPELTEAAPGDTPVPKVPESELTHFDWEGVTFSYDPALAAAVEPETVEAQTGDDLPPWELTPQHQRLVFLDYPLTDTYHPPQIFIYPVQDYLAVDPSAGDPLANLQQMLLMKDTENLPEQLPFFPNWNAGQVMATQVKYLDFKNGSGVRYLTQYAQDVYPIHNQSMFYTFQGLTSDGRWLVSAVLPVANPILPNPETLLEDPGFYDNYIDYLEEVKKLLNEQPDSSFQPRLSVLDAVFQSFEIQ